MKLLLQADLAGDRRLGVAARHRRLLVAAHRPGGPAQRAGRERADRRQAGGGLRGEPHRQPAVDPAGRRQDLRSDPLLGERESVVGGAAEISAARLSPERRLLRRRHVRRARHADRPAGLPREPEPLRRLQGARGDAADRRRRGRPHGPARRGAGRRAREWGRSSWGARCGCRTSCWRSPSIRSWAAGGGSWRPRCRSSGSGTTSPRWAAPIRTSRSPTGARGSSPPRRAAASAAWAPSDCPARAKAKRRPGRSSPSTCVTGGGSSAPLPRSPAGGWGRWSTRPSTPRCCRSTGSPGPR